MSELARRVQVKSLKLYLIAFIMGLTVTSLNASNLVDTLKSKNISAGIQSSLPSIGFSVRSDLSDKLSIQGVLGFFGNVDTYLARANYKLTEDQFFHTYGYATTGIWAYDYVLSTEFAVGASIGGGAEFDWQKIDKTLPPLYTNIELGITYTTLDRYNVSNLSLGFGLHYKF